MAVITATGYSYSPASAGYGINIAAVLGVRSYFPGRPPYSRDINLATDLKPIYLNESFAAPPVFPALPNWRKPVRKIG